MQEEQKLPIKLDDVLGLGRKGFIFSDGDHKIQLPQLHFIFYKDKDPNGKPVITALCIEFGLFYSHKDMESAQKNIEILCQQHTENILFGDLKKSNYFESIMRKLSSIKAEQYWEVYRLINFKTALAGKPTVDNYKREIIEGLCKTIDDLAYQNDQLKKELSEQGVNVMALAKEKNKTDKPLKKNRIYMYDTSYQEHLQPTSHHS